MQSKSPINFSINDIVYNIINIINTLYKETDDNYVVRYNSKNILIIKQKEVNVNDEFHKDISFFINYVYDYIKDCEQNGLIDDNLLEIAQETYKKKLFKEINFYKNFNDYINSPDIPNWTLELISTKIKNSKSNKEIKFRIFIMCTLDGSIIYTRLTNSL